jgi:hypothetical protein
MKILLVSLTGLLVAAGCILFVGCEAESANQAGITISPASATLSYGESVEFTASGWRDYKWSLTDASLGTLSRTSGDSTIYTSRTTNNAISYITAQSLMVISGSGTNAGSATTYLSGQAEIVHGTGGAAPSQSGQVTISVGGIAVTTVSVGKASSITMVASGGSSSYSWTVASTVYGNLNTTAGSTVTYLATTNAGDNTVTCTSAGASRSVTVTTL